MRGIKLLASRRPTTGIWPASAAITIAFSVIQKSAKSPAYEPNGNQEP
jgi:hypothetical protein